ncbi:hypothetical protein CON73_29870 [Bacillus toyonensis]|uniref:Uncharacterized protein n=1 Tax=Bacillus toyonensis TaxID=155322 RepID=A0A2B7VAB6_9BACI|nr:hypothetical protein COL90_31835 [Bacillus toyonensis]PGG81248.1 hypothetical protein CON73_29870 [Bacillus toyonensis]
MNNHKKLLSNSRCEDKNTMRGPHCKNIGFSEPTSTVTLRDLNGNPIVPGRRYLIESLAFPGQVISSETWHNGWYPELWAILKFESGEPIRFEQSGDHVLLLTDYTEVTIPEFDIEEPKYLSEDPTNPGVDFALRGSRSQWLVTEPTDPDLVAGNYYAFKNYYSGKFMSARDSLGWLYVERSSMESRTMWRFRPMG